jgi:5'-deoxynucleotidase
MSHFFALISRMKYINRWALMHNTSLENLSTHTLEVSMIAHALAEIGNARLGKNYDSARAAVLSMFHDASEIITGDMPTPVKYKNSEIKSVYKQIEKDANESLLKKLPDDLREIYAPLLNCDSEEDQPLLPLIKAADKISALIKCLEELKMGNKEFAVAAKTTRGLIEKMNLEEANIFINEFLDSFSLSLDEIGGLE